MNRWITIFLVTFGCSAAAATAKEAAVFDVMQYGAKGDGQTLDTAALQSAIDACTPGGVVAVPPGKYVTGTLRLKGDMELGIASGAELLGSTNLADYSRDIQGAVEGPAFDECLIFAENAKNITITGGGIINGRGHQENFPIKKSDGSLGDRPMLIRFVNCQGVTFENITFKDAASWCTHLINCDKVVARKVTIDSHVNKNNDGFDLDGCKDVLIEDCTIRSGDDSICPKSTTSRLTENVVVRNCRVTSNTAAFKCGTSSRGGFKNITVSDCNFFDTRMGAIKLLAVDGGILEDITIENIVMNNVEGPIFIRLGNRGRQYDAPTEQVLRKEVQPEGAPVGAVRKIRIRNIKAEVVSDDPARCGIMISGIPGHPVEDVVLGNIEISYPGGGTEEDARRTVPEDIARYPEQYFFGTLPSWGAYVRHARNIKFKNVQMTTRAPDVRPRIVQDDVAGFEED